MSCGDFDVIQVEWKASMPKVGQVLITTPKYLDGEVPFYSVEDRQPPVAIRWRVECIIGYHSAELDGVMEAQLNR